MRKLYAVLLALSLSVAVPLFAGESTSLEGWVTDAGCGAAKAGPDHAACAKKCIEMGKGVIFVDTANKQVYHIDNPDAIKGHEGHNVKVTGHVDADKKTIHVESVEMVSST